MSIKTESIQRVLRIEKRIPDNIDIWFAPTGEGKAFHCPSCGRFQFNRQHRIISMMEADMTPILKIPPISPQCQRCGCIFNIRIF